MGVLKFPKHGRPSLRLLEILVLLFSFPQQPQNLTDSVEMHFGPLNSPTSYDSPVRLLKNVADFSLPSNSVAQAKPGYSLGAENQQMPLREIHATTFPSPLNRSLPGGTLLLFILVVSVVPCNFSGFLCIVVSRRVGPT